MFGWSFGGKKLGNRDRKRLDRLCRTSVSGPDKAISHILEKILSSLTACEVIDCTAIERSMAAEGLSEKAANDLRRCVTQVLKACLSDQRFRSQFASLPDPVRQRSVASWVAVVITMLRAQSGGAMPTAGTVSLQVMQHAGTEPLLASLLIEAVQVQIGRDMALEQSKAPARVARADSQEPGAMEETTNAPALGGSGEEDEAFGGLPPLPAPASVVEDAPAQDHAAEPAAPLSDRDMFLDRMGKRIAEKVLPSAARDVVYLASEEIADRLEAHKLIHVPEIDDVLMAAYGAVIGPGAARAWTIEALTDAMRDPWFIDRLNDLPPAERRSFLYDWAITLAGWTAETQETRDLKQLISLKTSSQRQEETVMAQGAQMVRSTRKRSARKAVVRKPQVRRAGQAEDHADADVAVQDMAPAKPVAVRLRAVPGGSRD